MKTESLTMSTEKVQSDIIHTTACINIIHNDDIVNPHVKELLEQKKATNSDFDAYESFSSFDSFSSYSSFT